MRKPPKKKTLPLSRVYRLLESGPVVLLSTSRKGVPNVMPMSWHTMMDFEPPLVGFVLSDGDYSYETLRKTKECVLNIPTVDLVAKIVACGNCSGAKVDKFAAFGLTADPASKVSAPLVRECWVNLEAKLVDTKMVTKYGFFIVEVVKAWITPTPKRPCTVHHEGQGEFMVSGPTIRLRSSKA